MGSKQVVPVVPGSLGITLHSSKDRTYMDRIKLDVEFAMLLADFLLDLNCLYQYAVSGKHWGFAALQATIVVITLVAELRNGPAKLFTSFLESHALGFPTDTYLRIVKSEKSIEAPLSLLLQYVAAFHFSDSPEAFLSTCVSMVFSVLAVTKAAYIQLHLGLNELLDVEDSNPLEDAPLPSQPPSFPQFPPGIDLPQLPPGLPPATTAVPKQQQGFSPPPAPLPPIQAAFLKG